MLIYYLQSIARSLKLGNQQLKLHSQKASIPSLAAAPGRSHQQAVLVRAHGFHP